MERELTCSKCKNSKPVTEFSPKKTGKRGYASWCRTCTREAVRNYYHEDRQKARHNSRIMRRRQDNKERLMFHFGNCCKDCGGVFPSCVYDFHHLDPKEKDQSFRNLASCSWDRIEKEIIGKCVMLCSNCHRIRHHG